MTQDALKTESATDDFPPNARTSYARLRDA
jgi:hypothetical protein